VSEVRKHLNTANTELKAFITSHIKSQPALAALDDPVYIQLLAYMVIGAPLLLLFLPVLLWLATCLAPSAKVRSLPPALWSGEQTAVVVVFII
jgi:hypothetical protein